MMGDAAVAERDLPLAEQCYAHAHAHYPHNPRAALNLGVTRVERRDYAGALEALDHLAEEVGDGRDGDWVELRLAGQYNAALAHWYRAHETPAEDTADLHAALVLGRDLALVVGHLLLRPELDDERRSSLETLEGGGLALLAGIIVDAAGAGVDLGGVHAAVALEVPTVRRGLGRRPTSVAPPAWLEALAQEDWHRPVTVQVLERAARAAHDHDARTRYNLAVLRARLLRRTTAALGTDLVRADPERHGVGRAFRDLGFAVERDRGLVRWAEGDALIEPLRELDPERFDEILRRAAPPG